MPLTIMGKSLKANATANEVAALGATQPHVNMTDRETEKYDPLRNVRVREQEYAYVDLKNEQTIGFLSAEGVKTGTAVYFYNENERLLVVVAGKFDYEWKTLLAPFKDRSNINVMIIGNFIPPNVHSGKPFQMIQESILRLHSTLHKTFAYDQEYHLNMTYTRQATENQATEREIPEMVLHYLYHKLNQNSWLHCGKPLARTVAFNNPNSNFTASLSNMNTAWFDLICEFIQIPVSKAHNLLIDALPVAKDDVFIWMANALFTKQGLQKFKPILSREPYLGDFAINLATHKVFLCYSDRVQTNQEQVRRMHLYTTQDQTPLQVYSSQSPSINRGCLFPSHIPKVVDTWSERSAILSQMEFFCAFGDRVFGQLLVSAIVSQGAAARPGQEEGLKAFISNTQTVSAQKTVLMSLMRKLLTDFIDMPPVPDSLLALYACMFIDLIRAAKNDPSCLVTIKSYEAELARILPQYKNQLVLNEKKALMEIHLKSEDEAKTVGNILQEHNIKRSIAMNATTGNTVLRIECNPENWHKLKSVSVKSAEEMSAQTSATSSTAAPAAEVHL